MKQKEFSEYFHNYLKNHSLRDIEVQDVTHPDPFDPYMFTELALHLSCFPQIRRKIANIYNRRPADGDGKTIEELEEAETLLPADAVEPYRQMLEIYRCDKHNDLINDIMQLSENVFVYGDAAYGKDPLFAYVTGDFVMFEQMPLYVYLYWNGQIIESDGSNTDYVYADPFITSEKAFEKLSKPANRFPKQNVSAAVVDKDRYAVYRREIERHLQESNKKNKTTLIGTSPEGTGIDRANRYSFATESLLTIASDMGINLYPALQPNMETDELHEAFCRYCGDIEKKDTMFASVSFSVALIRLIKLLQAEQKYAPPKEIKTTEIVEKVVVKEVQAKEPEDVQALRRKIKNLQSLLDEERQKNRDLMELIPEDTEVIPETPLSPLFTEETAVADGKTIAEMAAAVDESKIIFVSGHGSWIQKMKEVFKDASFIDAFEYTRMTPGIFSGKKHIFYNVNWSDHGMYYSAERLKDEDARIHFIRNNNTLLCVKEVYDATR